MTAKDGDGLKEFLSLVSKPVRYLGSEIHSIRKDLAKVKLKFCLAFPDVYEVGMSHLGIQILYHILNAKEEVACERAFAPWVDMENVLRRRQIPLSSLESSTPLNQFDIVGFSLQYELCLTNVLNMLALSNIPLFSTDRDNRFPIIIAGGPLTFNPAPIADFFDALVIGDGEEVALEICEIALQSKEAGARKEDFLKSLSQLEGVYVPSMQREAQKIHKRVVTNINQAPFPTCPIVPFMKVVHDRLNIEIARGCKRGCRFCEAGFVHRPYRERSPESIHEILGASLKQTGYEELSLLSLSAGDYSSIEPLLSNLMDQLESKKVAVSFPSLRIESVVGQLADQVKRVRKTGFTVAPEAGTERLRSVINKELDERVFFQGLSELFSKGWKNIKLYFMMGLPTEKEEDLRGIFELTKKITSLAERQKIHPNINVSVSTFVPKPHTPFQWEAQIPLEEMKEKLHLVRDGVKRNHLGFKWQDPHLSFLEGIFSTGDRNLSRVLVEAYRLGCRFDGWSDQFRYPLWEEAFQKTGLKIDVHTQKKKRDDVLPWSLIETGMDARFLWEEYQRGLNEKTSAPCVAENCRRCGICNGKTILVREGTSAEVGGPEKEVRRDIQKKERKKKIRLKFKKVGEMRFLSHLELAHLFYRASKRAGLPLCFSEGFHPMPKIVFATALPVGMESLTEIVDMECDEKITPSEVVEKLNRTLPPGIEIKEAEEVPLFFHLSSLTQPSIYWVPLDHFSSQENAILKIKEILDKKEFLIHQERDGKKRSVDIRPLIEKMEIKKKSAEGDQWGMELALRRTNGRTAKPVEIVGAVLRLEGAPLAQLKVIKLE
ncbi:MAG TPA: TIGR03960 family B12-binding radical SAM protein [Thermodesulfobacteriota bacterium]|nr:TIGR03960 family B12-binding radical SAM protein [Thermodesulfobacteriota bacterium]